MCLEAVPEPEGVRISAAALLKIWEGDVGGGGNVMCICVGVFRPQAATESTTGVSEAVDVASLSGARLSITWNEPFSMLGGEFVVGVRAIEAGVGVRGVATFVFEVRVSTTGTAPLGAFDSPLV